MGEVILRMSGIHKYYPSSHAVNDAQLELKSGEVMALVGENGAGKSTLMNILTGSCSSDSGTIELFGNITEIRSPAEAHRLGIHMVHQELNQLPDLTVAANIFIGCEPTNGIFINQKQQNKMAAQLLESLHINLSPTARVCDLTVAEQQMVEIAKALSFDNTRILVLDEPTATLTQNEIEDLFGFIRQLKKTGVGIIYISHRMEELKQITDRITVMRDGQYVKTVVTADTTVDEIVRLMIGRTVYDEPKSKSAVSADAPIVLEAEHLQSSVVRDVSFCLRRGEILGIAGLMGAGRTEAMRLLYGADKRDGGMVRVNGAEVTIKNPKDAVKVGIGYLSEDRARYGLCLGLSVCDNTVLSSLEKFSGPFLMHDRQAFSTAYRFNEKVNTKTSNYRKPIRGLSGGNQQKVIIAKWLVRDCDILIFDEPTRGIDVGAKSEIYKLMNQLAAEGKSIIMVSSDLPELLRMSDRILVMCEGRITGELDIADATQEKIMTFATQTA